MPVDVIAIARNYADVRLVPLPRTIDGLAVRKAGERSKILVNKTAPEVRQRFTAAHELGHILIPWHIGISVDAFESTLAGGESVESDDEAEANQFAAELLLPSKQVKAALRNGPIGKAILELHAKAKVSIAVACLAAMANSQRAHLLILVGGASEVLGSYKTPDSWLSKPLVGSNLTDPKGFLPGFRPEIQIVRASPYEDARTIFAWTFDAAAMWRRAEKAGDWRSTLTAITQDLTDDPKLRAAFKLSFAGLAGFANNLIQRHSLTVKRRFELLLHRAISNETVARMAGHEMFPTLLAQRARSLKPRKQTPEGASGN